MWSFVMHPVKRISRKLTWRWTTPLKNDHMDLSPDKSFTSIKNPASERHLTGTSWGNRPRKLSQCSNAAREPAEQPVSNVWKMGENKVGWLCNRTCVVKALCNPWTNHVKSRKTCLALSIPFPISSSTTASQMRNPLKKSLVPSYTDATSTASVCGLRWAGQIIIQKIHQIFTLCIPSKWCSVTVPYINYIPVVEIWSWLTKLVQIWSRLSK